MRRYRVTVGGQLHVLDVQEVSAHEFRVSVAGRELEVTLSGAEDVAESVISPEIAPRGTTPVPSAASFRPVSPDTLPPMVTKSPPPLPAAPDLVSDGVVKAPMPGTITVVDVRVGETVAKGQTLAKLEAMKMVNAIRAPRGGRVATVHVAAGESVAYGQPLVTLEEG